MANVENLSVDTNCSFAFLDNNDLNYSFDAEQYGTDFILNPVDVSLVKAILHSSPYTTLPNLKPIECKDTLLDETQNSLSVSFDFDTIDGESICDKALNASISDTSIEVMDNELNRNLCELKAVDMNNIANSGDDNSNPKTDILQNAFTIAMQCNSPLTPASSIDLTEDDQPLSPATTESDVPPITAILNTQCSTPDSSFENASRGTSSPDSGFSDCGLDTFTDSIPGNTSATSDNIHTDHSYVNAKTDSAQISYEKPDESYVALIARAILKAQDGRAALSNIYEYMLENYPYFRTAKPAWRISVRHNLSTNECFVKLGRVPCSRGYWWGIHPLCEEEFSKGNFNWAILRRRIQQLHMQAKIAEKTQVNPMNVTQNRPKPGPKTGGKAPVAKRTVHVIHPYHPVGSNNQSVNNVRYFKQPATVPVMPVNNASYPDFQRYFMQQQPAMRNQQQQPALHNQQQPVMHIQQQQPVMHHQLPHLRQQHVLMQQPGFYGATKMNTAHHGYQPITYAKNNQYQHAGSHGNPQSSVSCYAGQDNWLL